jgi:glyoxylase-like metal-dependent hydrolase (beta-lactamase superfamily II)
MTGPARLPFRRLVVPTPYRVGPANVYLFPDDPITLFDCGPNTPATETALMLGLESAGVRPEQIARVVISHAHPDHYGMAPRLRAISGARILLGERDLPKLVDRSMLAATGRLLLRAGMPMDELVDMGERERRLGDLRPDVEGAETLAEGDRLGFDGFDLEVLHLPGHTAGHICLYHRESATLFSGDTLLLDISPNPLIEPDPMDPRERRRSLIEYLASLDRLAELSLSVVYPGHGEPIEKPHAVIEEMRGHHRDRAVALARLLDDEGKTGWGLAHELFPSLEGFDNFLAVSEVVAHLDLLIDQGIAAQVDRDGVLYYRRTQATSAAIE